MFGFAGDANDSISNAYPLKARRRWRAFFCTAKLHSAAPSTNADRAEGLVMSEQAEKFLAQWEFEHIADSDIVRARTVRTKRGAWHCSVERMQPKQGSAARTWKLLLRGFDRQYASSVGSCRVSAALPRPVG
jgi:hypothetical protein